MKKLLVGKRPVLLGALLTVLSVIGSTASAEQPDLSASKNHAPAEAATAELTPAEVIAAMALPGTPPAASSLQGRVFHPDDLDPVTKQLGIPARLVNFNLAALVNLSEVGLGQAVYLPVAISQREGGRKSLYYLEPGEEVLAGLFFTNTGMALRYVKRVTGSGLPARTGDIYVERYTNRAGQEIFAGQGRLEVIDPAIGHGRVTLTHTPSGAPLPKGKVSVWIFWSCIKVESETK